MRKLNRFLTLFLLVIGGWSFAMLNYHVAFIAMGAAVVGTLNELLQRKLKP